MFLYIGLQITSLNPAFKHFFRRDLVMPTAVVPIILSPYVDFSFFNDLIFFVAANPFITGIFKSMKTILNDYLQKLHTFYRTNSTASSPFTAESFLSTNIPRISNNFNNV